MNKPYLITVDVGQLKPDISPDRIEKLSIYKFKDLGYLTYSKSNLNGTKKSWGGFITPERLKAMLTTKQWMKFCSGKRKFVIYPTNV